ncbi:MAG: endonuclease/exonuclease/phosphatase family protein [Opitutaceae bacterium]|jgi:endonuclease/exonuclease/phosphatase family metal-dependent hydrolase
MSMTRLRLVTFNIAHGRGLNPIQGLASPRKVRANLLKIARLLHTVEADIVAMQEIDRNSIWAGSFDHLLYLQTHARFPHAVYGINNHLEGLLKLSYGNAFLSRLPILTSENVVFGRKRVGEKGFLFVEIDVGGKIIPIINLHLHYRSRVQRMRQLDHLTAWLKEWHKEFGKTWYMPPIVCGDFNTSRTALDAVAYLLAHMHRFGEYRAFPHEGHTFPSPWPQRTVDFVFVPKQCRHAHAVVVRSYLSDHRPVLVEFDV